MKISKHLVMTCAVFFAATLSISESWAHGERSLEPFVRMRTIQWYDVSFSKSDISVNEELVMKGKFHVAEDWPNNIPEPELAYLGLISPGPVFVRKERTINGEPHLNSLPLVIGGDYEFKVVLRGRIPGKYHVHPSFNVKDTGNIAGPGQWIEITGSAEDFSNEIKTLQGNTIEMETYGTATGVRWHMFWIVVGTFWLIWWLRRPLFIPRYNMLKAGEEGKLVTSTDINIAKGLLVSVPLIVLFGYINAVSIYDETIPLQTPIDRIAPLNKAPDIVTTKVQRADYDVSNRAMTLSLLVTNNGPRPLHLGELSSGSIRFIDSEANVEVGDYPEEYVATTGLDVQPEASIPTGETVELTVVAQDAAWEIE
ncbi:MAG: methane monooxygenase/ammonia monooxygenase subunit B, partial [Pseudomonadales bacterium]|nr:methane monooxygenase/ammonia monooxygenase subunit B [Pseudomonadales bacterium]